MVESFITLVVIVAVAIVLFILVDKAGLPDPLGLIFKLAILIVALLAAANRFGYV